MQAARASARARRPRGQDMWVRVTPWTTLLAASIAAAATYFFLRSRSRSHPDVRRRAAFDIGSGSSKVLVADVSVATGIIIGDPIYEIELPCAYKADSQQQPDGSLSSGIIEQGLAVVESLAAVALEHGATEAYGVATEVFRTAPNGMDFLSRVAERTGVAVATISQEREARLGLATAEALLGGPRLVHAAWDSGGGSFQITARGEGPQADGAIDAVPLRTYVGKLGTGPAFHRLTTVQHKAYESTTAVNPASAKDAAALVSVLIKELPPAPEWLQGASIIAIGGWNCLFATTLRALRSLVAAEAYTDGGDADGAAGSFTLADARRALSAVCGQTDEQLLVVSGSSKEAESPRFVVPKIALLVAVASQLGLERIRFVPATGGCAGLMALGEFTPLAALGGASSNQSSCAQPQRHR